MFHLLARSAAFGFAGLALAATPADWQTRSIYQLLTDRFARTDGSTTAACDPATAGYCGGTWQGIIDQLDYIQGMGFDAVWISPVTEQIDDPTRAYHGYSQQNLYNVNTNFGSYEDLQSLAAALHDKNMYLMVDVVANHFGYNGDITSTPLDYSTMTPFNTASYFHPICWIDNDYSNQTIVEICWLGSEKDPLPDVYTTLPEVRATYSSWVQGLIANYSVDGLRIDSVTNVEPDFWSVFQKAAGIYAVGEVSDSDVALACPYQDDIDGLLNYPMYYQLTPFFESSSTTPDNLVAQIAYLNSLCTDYTLLAPFSENHDQPRFPSLNPDMSLAENVIAFTLLFDGIPIIYSGQEQHLDGGVSPLDREAIWLTGYDTSATLYGVIAQLNAIRKFAISQDSNGSYVVYQAIVNYYESGTRTLSATATRDIKFERCPSSILRATEILSCTEVTIATDDTLTRHSR
ncbi:glycoside hydrolase family 13 protein [Athelia psychrophila]|uniref:Glycoside hydrolase family 13 protein n=1 Tax=Athelia psychrophila TaxID=1759441 RepID=A0A166IB69_9AGAM|nr:glycoside hydrolase family 13 protein [Fibularhizoctonia sp. CBS 109695]